MNPVWWTALGPIAFWDIWVSLGALVGLLWFQKHLMAIPDWSFAQKYWFFLEIVCLSLLGGWLGARVVGEWAYQWQGGKSESFLQGPMAISGSWGFFLLGGRLWTYYRRYPWFLFLNQAFPSLAIALSIGRLGCWFNGCDYGWVIENDRWHFPLFYSHHTEMYHWPWPLFESAGSLVLLMMYQWGGFGSYDHPLKGWKALLALLGLRIVLDPLRGEKPVYLVEGLPNLHLMFHMGWWIILWLLKPLPLQKAD